MTKGDKYTKTLFRKILKEGCMDITPRPHYADGTPAHTLSINHAMCTYDLSKGDSHYYPSPHCSKKCYWGAFMDLSGPEQ